CASCRRSIRGATFARSRGPSPERLVDRLLLLLAAVADVGLGGSELFRCVGEALAVGLVARARAAAGGGGAGGDQGFVVVCVAHATTIDVRPARSLSLGCAGGGGRTHTPFRAKHFECSASAIPPHRRTTTLL